MKNRIKNKLRSHEGASVTFALLLFLVCAVLSSVVIVAATAASGRMKKLAENDQRYYCVTSAVKLLKDTLDGQCITVVWTVENEEDSSSDTTEYLMDNGSIIEPDYYMEHLMTWIAHQYAKTSDMESDPGEFPVIKEFQLSIDDVAELVCDITAKLDEDKTVALIVSKTNGSESNDQYSLKITFVADVVEVEESNEATGEKITTTKVTLNFLDIVNG